MDKNNAQPTPILERGRIDDLLTGAMAGGVLILVAGQGYGKTTAVRSFLRKGPEMSLWWQVSGNHSLPVFWENFTRFVGQKNAGAAAKLREIGVPQTVPQFDNWMEISAGLFNDREKLIVVLDDFHLLKSQKALEFINRIIRRPMPGIFLILICRKEPEIDTISLLSKGRLARIEADELVFTRDETAAYFRLLGISVSDSDIDGIQNGTEGWPLLVGMTAAEMQKGGNGENVFRRFADSLFFSLSREFQDCLVLLSFFEKGPVDLNKRIFELFFPKYRERKGLMAEIDRLTPLIHFDYYLPGYRFYGPFREYLCEKQRDLPHDKIREISEIGAQWCLENHLTQEAAVHFERAENYEGIADIVISYPHIVPPSVAAPLLEIVNRIISKKNPGPLNGAPLHGDADYSDYLECIIRPRLMWCLDRPEYPGVLLQENIAR
jgi:LuxR family maltose regulon positive regulatory protein